MTEEWEELHAELKKISRGAESAPQYLRHLMKMFVSDFEESVSKRLDVKFWSKLKSMMDEMKKASENDRVVDLNVQSLAVGFITDLSLLVHSHYEIPDFGENISPVLAWSPSVYGVRKPVKSKKHCRVFLAYILLRMGDLMRYKEHYSKAKEFYEQSCRINPADGSVWNQLGLISVLSVQYLESVYFHTRALHATLDFQGASGSLTTIFKKFANRDISKPMPFNELYLACLAKIHFLLEIEDSDRHMKTIGENAATSKEMLIPIMSVYSHLEDGTELEQRAIGYIQTLWEHSYSTLLETLAEDSDREDLLHLLSFFHSAPKLLEDVEDSEVSTNSKIVAESLENSVESPESDIVTDNDGFRYFKCLEDRPYPLRKSFLAAILKGTILEESIVDEESKDSTPRTFSSSSSPTKSSSRSPVKSRRVPDPDSSDEEILQRGRRRGRAAARANESIDTDDDDDF